MAQPIQIGHSYYTHRDPIGAGPRSLAAKKSTIGPPARLESYGTFGPFV